jgi:Secretion system C-terminal sorting domain
LKKLYFLFLLFVTTSSFGQAGIGPALIPSATNPVLVSSSGLTFSGYVGSNIGLAAGVNNSGQDLNKSFGAQTSGSVYASFLVSVAANTGAGGYFFHFYDPTASTAFRARTFIKPKNGQMMVGFSFNQSKQQDSLKTLLNFGQTYLFVAKYKIVDGLFNDSVSLYVFAEGDNFSTEPVKPSLGPLASLDVTTDIVPTCIALRQFEAAQRITVDGFRVKTKWQFGADDVAGVNAIKADPTPFYPNPVSNGIINFANQSNELKQVEIFDMVGRKIFEKNTTSNSMDVRTLKTGVYSIKVQANDNTTSSKLVVK